MRDNLPITTMGQSQNILIRLSKYKKNIPITKESLKLCPTYKIPKENSPLFNPETIGEIIAINIYRTTKIMLALQGIW